MALQPASTESRTDRNAIASHWSAPPPGYSKVNCDAAWVPPDRTGLGVIIRDHSGSLVGGSAIPTACGAVSVAEAKAVLSGVDLAISLSPIIEQIKRRCSAFDDCCWDWVPREANRAGHKAASLAFRTVGPSRWANQPPPSLTLVLRNDGLPCPHGTEL